MLLCLLCFIQKILVTSLQATYAILYKQELISSSGLDELLVQIIPKNQLIIPEYSLILFSTYYSKNYSGIIDGSLITDKVVHIQ